MVKSVNVLRGVEVEFGDPTQDVIWLRYGDDDMHYLLPAEATTTVNGEVRARSWLLQWLAVNRGEHMIVDLSIDTEPESGLQRIEAAGFRCL